MQLGANINTPSDQWPTGLSADGSILYFASDRPGGVGAGDLWQASILPIVDFNGDEIVDINDLVTLIEHWGTHETFCDIGPMPWGDGVVDAPDLEVLMRCWEQQVLPGRLLPCRLLPDAWRSCILLAGCLIARREMDSRLHGAADRDL
jgi:hypothetical protein